MGFGLVNTVAVAAKYAQRVHGAGKVVIVDFDVHHGNGTEEAFWRDPSVLYISTHQAGLWPATGKATAMGAAGTPGEGATINVPLPGGTGGDVMRMAFEQVVLPAAERFQPDLVLVSAGYDAHWRDPLAGLQLESSAYRWLCSQLAALACRTCGGRLALVLEGGYHLPSLSESVVESFWGLLEGSRNATPGSNPGRVIGGSVPHVAHAGSGGAALPPEPLAKAQQVLEQVRQLHRI